MTTQNSQSRTHTGERTRATQQLLKALQRSRTIEKMILALLILTAAALPATIVAENSNNSRIQPVAATQLMSAKVLQP